LTLSGYGAAIVATDIEEEGIAQTAEMVKEAGGRAIYVKLDVTDKAQVEAAVDAAVEEFGRIDILCNNAGIGKGGMLKDLDERTWDQSMDINAKGQFLVAQAVSCVMMKQRYGRIINTASQAGRIAEYANVPYCVSKSAVCMLTQVLALELAEYDIMVNALAPSYIDTELLRRGITQQAAEQGKTYEELMGTLLKTVPLGRMAKPEEIAELVAFLASEKNSYMTGTLQFITGGKFMQ
jgi:NAD(P)-dependent dehydrogenase (short-subunit alcohol dehydrogenase family)